MLRNVDAPAHAAVLRTGVLLAAVLAPLQILVGDLHGLNTLEHQPAKIAAIEGIWETETGAPLTLFGMPDEESGARDFAIEIPERREPDPHARRRRRSCKGLDEFPASIRRCAGVLVVPRDGRHRAC